MNKVITGVVIVVLCLIMGSCVSWRWGECKKVGHGTLYCIMDMGR